MNETVFTLDDLRRVMRAAAGDSDVADIDGDIIDVSFDELGYDSLAMLECSSRIEREFRLTLSDDVVSECGCPRELVDHVNARIAEAYPIAS
jgi:act minimal PKS acyl carrier protein